uniref:Uncharacterized protein n=1 Tax=viral metagenome TaxID=1070528 RepID=A0A6H1ZQ70_9ZZZZ
MPENTGIDMAIDQLFKTSAAERAMGAANPEVLNPQPVQASVPQRTISAERIRQKLGGGQTMMTAGQPTTEVMPEQPLAPPETQAPSVAQQFGQAGQNILGGIGRVFEAIDDPMTMLYGWIQISFKKMKGQPLTPQEETFYQQFQKERPMPTTPQEYITNIPQVFKGTFAPSEQLRESYNSAFDTKTQIIHSLANPIWYAIPGAVATKGVLAGKAAQAGIKGRLASIGEAAITPFAAVETGIGKLISLPFKGTAKLVGSLRKRGDAELANQVSNLIARAKAGEAIDPTELLAVTKKSGKIAQDVNEVLRQIKLEQSPELIGDATKPLWTKLTPARKRAIVKAADLGEEVSRKSWKLMSDAEKSAINRLYLEPENLPVVQKITKSLEDVPVYSQEQKFQRAGATAQKGAKLSKELAKATTPEEVAAAQTKALTGEMPKVPFGKITTDDGKELFGIIQNSPVLQYRPFDKMRLLTAPTKSVPDGGALWKLMNGILPQDNEIQLLQEVLGKKFADSLRAMQGQSGKVVSNLLALTNLPRALVSSVDFSTTLRQAVILAYAEPKLAAKSFKAQVKSFFSEKAYDDAMAQIRAHPLYGKAREMGLVETHLSPEKAMGLREEPFISKWTMNIPLVKQSARAFTTMTNKIRFDAAYKYLASKPQFWSEDEAKWLMRLLNWETGRGPVPASWLPALASIFFSPALQMARIAMPVALVKASPTVRKLAWRHFIQFVGANVGILATLKATGAIDLETDPTSTDFGKIRIGNTRLDTWGGFLPYWRLMNRLAKGEYKTQSGKIMEVDRFSEVERAVLMKFAPFPGLIADILRGETIVGDELTLAPEDIKNQAINRFAPFVAQDIMEAIEEDGWTGGLAASSSIVGVGAVSYPSRVFADWLESIESYTGQDWDFERIQSIRPAFEDAEASWIDYLNLPSAKARTYARKEDPMLDASLYFWGETSDLANPKQSRQIVQQMLDTYDLDWKVLPIKPPTEPYERNGKTDEEVILDMLDLFPQDITDYFQANQDVFANRDLDEYMNLVQTTKLDDYRKVKLFEILTYDDDKAKMSKDKEKYRKEHPDVDAAYNFWNAGVKTLMSKEAESLLQQKLQLLGIPADALLQSTGATKGITTLGGQSSKTGGTGRVAKIRAKLGK